MATSNRKNDDNASVIDNIFNFICMFCLMYYVLFYFRKHLKVLEKKIDKDVYNII